jgi:hypothetical protein
VGTDKPGGHGIFGVRGKRNTAGGLGGDRARDERQGNQHIHIAASLVRIDGSKVDIWRDRKTLSRVCAELEHAYGLTVVEGERARGCPG